ncbi:PTS system ascorbate-specific IIB component [Caldalkalibacillus uzonensis]|uniref:PTS system ascorbate-specific IIB component n=1 Tax=Caldalkalibacillus uzonensis TaxID=353224 RepID=A0ABU0CTE3_9BACI|nr:PTS sugar transporter subunit IIB [Caldalkalibacillus uzonensis]MDQ0338775.1 PTS system ascorbate-specific IIB component [Caldalkalibacillus uzonensis]
MKIVTVCGMGLGSSLMLKMTVEKVLKEKGIKATVETCDFSAVSGVEADIILTNAEFAKQINHAQAKVAAVRNIASQEEVSTVLEQLLED